MTKCEVRMLRKTIILGISLFILIIAYNLTRADDSEKTVNINLYGKLYSKAKNQSSKEWKLEILTPGEVQLNDNMKYKFWLAPTVLDNQLDGLESLTKLENLEELIIPPSEKHEGPYSVEKLKPISKMKSLKKLAVFAERRRGFKGHSLLTSRRTISSKVFKWMEGLKNLEELFIRLDVLDNEIEALEELESLKTLEIKCDEIYSNSYPCLSKITSLKKFTLYGDFNGLKQRKPIDLNWIEKLKKLEDVSFCLMHLKRNAFGCLADLPNLRRLKLRSPLSEEEYSQIGNFKSLEEIDLFMIVNKYVTDDNIDVIVEHEKLKRIKLDGIAITNKSITKLCNKKDLEILEIFNNKLPVSLFTDSHIKTLFEQKSLKGLLMVGYRTAITENGYKCIGKINNLKYLCLYVPLSDNKVKAFKKLESLEALDLCNIGKKMTSCGYGFLKSLSKLKFLSLSGFSDSLHDESMEVFENLINLERLYLSSENISNQGLKHLKELKKIKKLKLFGCKVSNRSRKFV